MRLRLSVQRHRLPLANILWSVPDGVSPLAYTIARLLEDVNAILPLEAEEWGLEDYVVEVNGFECLHFALVSQTLKDDDQVLIRPLLTAEVRSRTLCGRYQISDSGQHLVDGIPFGRPLLRTPSRPQINIPPRKRQRLLMDHTMEDGDNDISHNSGLITSQTGILNQESGVDVSDGDADGGHQNTRQAKRRKTGKSVRFAPLPEGQSNDDDDDEDDDDGDFAPDEVIEDSDASLESGTDEESDDSDDSTSISDSSTDPGSDSDTSSSDSDSDSESGEEIESDVSTPEQVSAKTTPPGLGSSHTKSRNRRRYASKLLRRLKSTGVIPEDATIKDMDKLNHIADEPTPKRNTDPIVTSHTPREKNTTKKRKRDEIEPVLTQPTTTAIAGISQGTSTQETTIASPPSQLATRRLRPDVRAISRILSHQARQAGKEAKKQKIVEIGPELPPDPDFWKSRINLTAYECWHEECDLSAPSFPFKQHWDPQSKHMHRDSKQKKKKAVDEDSASSAEAPGNYENSEHDTATAVESQLLQDVAAASHPDLPPLPEDIEALPALSQADIKVGTAIVFKMFDLNPTNMNPEISRFKTALVEDEGDSGNGAGEIKLRLAQRDIVRKEKKYNRKGQRIYDHVDKFGAEDSDEEKEQDDGVLFLNFLELLEPKLLKAAGEKEGPA